MPAKIATTETPKKTGRKSAKRKTVSRIKVSHKEEPLTSATAVRERPVKLNYIFAVGRRKEAIARVRWTNDAEPTILINERDFAKYFPSVDLQYTVRQPLLLTQHDQRGSVSAKVNGGGIQGQAEAVRLGIARALVKEDPDLRIPLKRAGFLRRDPRSKERKKYGLKRARRAPQWQKR